MARSWNPIAFTPLPVSFFLTATYVAIFAVLLVIHHELPPAPKQETPRGWAGVNLTTAWHDLQVLSATHHPYNSRVNLDVRTWLVGRIGDILQGNNASFTIETSGQTAKARPNSPTQSSDVVLFDDRQSNKTFPDSRAYLNYFEADNVMVYVRGNQDPQGSFWLRKDAPTAHLVLVNAHFDSVSTGYGTTDDGVGVISVMQVLAHLTAPGADRPEHGVLLLLNNGEEDGLYGAEAFTQHPISRHTAVFLNLEGAGAGGRATLFRATDGEVTIPYGKSEHPFGTVVSADGFKRGLVRSGTDYSVFHKALGMRGLDVAFMGPRSAYHTARDDVRDSSKDSLWHMLSAALTTTDGLAKKTWETGREHEEYGVWFDLLGRGFAVIRLHALFALSITLLAVGPVVLIVLEVLLKKSDKWYPFSLKTYLHGSDDDKAVQLGGLKGFFRIPLALIGACAAPIALAFLLTKINPFIIYGSQYAVWSMMISAFVCIAWFLLRLADSVRPSALSRFYTLLWLYALSWILVVAFAVGADRLELGGDYFFVTLNATVFVALLISYLELFALPSKQKYADHVVLGAAPSLRRPSQVGRPTSSRTNDDGTDANERTALLSPTDRTDGQSFARYNRGEEAVEDESTPLFDSEPYEHEQDWSSGLPRWTWLLQMLLLIPLNLILLGQIALFATTALTQTPADGNPVLEIYLAIALLTIIMFVPSTPFIHRLIWQIPTFLFLVCVGTAVYNLIADPFSRESRLKVFFVQRLNATSNENQVALIGVPGWLEQVVAEIPSTSGQEVECTDGDKTPVWARRNELRTCIWSGLHPNLMQGYSNTTIHTVGSPASHATSLAPFAMKPATKSFVTVTSHTISTNATTDSRKISVRVTGLNTKACRLYFQPTAEQQITDVTVLTACPDLATTTTVSHTKKNHTNHGDVHGCPAGEVQWPAYHPSKWRDESVRAAHRTQIRLWSRSMDPTFDLVVELGASDRNAFSAPANPSSPHRSVDAGTAESEGGPGELKAIASCIYSDANQRGTVPALDELWAFAPVWATVTKGADALVEVVKDVVL